MRLGYTGGMLETGQRSNMRWASVVGAVALVVACGEDDARPAPAADCNDTACMAARNGVPISIVGAGTDLGGAGAGGGGGMPGPGAGTLAGTVLELTAADLQT